MARCATWRFTDVGDLTRILPVGGDHKVWRPCRERVPTKGAWCEDCVTAMILCPELEVRRALVEHPGLDERFLRDLTTDPDYITSRRAAVLLHERGGIWS
jgi:hypothetical protein